MEDIPYVEPVSRKAQPYVWLTLLRVVSQPLTDLTSAFLCQGYLPHWHLFVTILLR